MCGDEQRPCRAGTTQTDAMQGWRRNDRRRDTPTPRASPASSRAACHPAMGSAGANRRAEHVAHATPSDERRWKVRTLARRLDAGTARKAAMCDQQVQWAASCRRAMLETRACGGEGRGGHGWAWPAGEGCWWVALGALVERGPHSRHGRARPVAQDRRRVAVADRAGLGQQADRGAVRQADQPRLRGWPGRCGGPSRDEPAPSAAGCASRAPRSRHLGRLTALVEAGSPCRLVGAPGRLARCSGSASAARPWDSLLPAAGG
jgi:hypothetical protein